MLLGPLGGQYEARRIAKANALRQEAAWLGLRIAV